MRSNSPNHVWRCRNPVAGSVNHGGVAKQPSESSHTDVYPSSKTWGRYGQPGAVNWEGAPNNAFPATGCRRPRLCTKAPARVRFSNSPRCVGGPRKQTLCHCMGGKHPTAHQLFHPPRQGPPFGDPYTLDPEQGNTVTITFTAANYQVLGGRKGNVTANTSGLTGPGLEFQIWNS